MREFRAKARYVWVRPYKVRSVARMIKKKPYYEALGILDVLPNKGARILAKVIRSAAGNAVQKEQSLDQNFLYVKNLMVDEGPRVSRLWARGRGRADVQKKRMSHIQAVLGVVKE